VRLLVASGLVAAGVAAGCHAPTPAEKGEAARHYQSGIELLAAGKLSAAREEMRRGTQLAPMDATLYLPLARACRDRGLEQRAVEFYRKYLATSPADGAEAAAELAAIDADLDWPAEPERPLWPGLVLSLLLASAVAWWWTRARAERRRLCLARLCSDNPELQPAIAYLVGCLRHELFKHRILAVGDAVRALAGGDAVSGQREFLTTRLYGGAPLPVAWAGHLASFIRALGPRFDLSRHDPDWSAAGRAVSELARLEVRLLRGDRDAAPRLLRAWTQLREFDRRLGSRLRGLTHTPIDHALLEEVAASVRSEGAAEVQISVGEVPPGVNVVVYRVDLELVLRNLVRNAVRAAARAPGPARVQLDVEVQLEPTGEEAVRVRVRDTSPEPLPRDLGPRRDRGLGLVAEALDRYDGSLEVGGAEGEWQKSVSLRLFRALDDVLEEAA
jgi:tetratricopeptide (TPR) repeat protein